MSNKIYTFVVVLAALVLLGFTPPERNGKMLVDQADVLTDQQEQELNQKLVDYEKQTSNEIAVLTLTSLDGEDIKDVGYDTGMKWGVGKGKEKGDHDNGVVLVVAVKDRKMRIEVGKGVEGELTDLESLDIIKRVIGPQFKRKNFYGGIDAGVNAIKAQLDSRGSAAVPPNTSANRSGGGNMFWFVLAILGGGIFLFVIFRPRRRSSSYSSSSYTPRTRPTSYTRSSSNYGSSKKSSSSSRKSSSSSSSYTPPSYDPPSYDPPSFGGGGGSDFGGGGFDFGGGDFGGGGADGDW